MAFEENVIKLALYVACNDGVLSEVEELQLLKSCLTNFQKINEKTVNCWIEEFFAEDHCLENYCDRIGGLEDRLIALKIIIETAAADGLELRENLALSRVMNYWNISLGDVTGV